MARRNYRSMFEPYKDKIFQLIDQGYSAKQVYEILFKDKEGYAYPTLTHYIVKRRRTGDLPKGKFDKIPKCSECESLKRITRCIAEQNDILMCQQMYREVNRYGISNCPTWCPKKVEIMKEGMKIGNQ